MKEYLVTDHYNNYKNEKSFKKSYLELPIYNEKKKLVSNIIFYKKWKNYKKKLSDFNEIYKLYKYYLNELTIFLNNYHNKKYSKRYWTIILTPWLFNFITIVFYKWNLISSLKNKKYIFIKKEITSKDAIPLGIEDFQRMSISNFWNHYIVTKIIEYNFKKKIIIKNDEKISKNFERDKIYEKLKNITLKERLSFFIQKLCNFLPIKKNYLIFSTYLSNFDEIKLNLYLNKFFLYYKMLRPYHLYRKNFNGTINRKNLHKLKTKNNNFEKFLSKEILLNLPLTFLEYFNDVEERKYFVEPHIQTFAKFEKYKNKDVLEIGCGIGTDTISFLRNGANVIAVDISEESIKIAKQRAKLFNLNNSVNFIKCNIEEIDSFITNKKFDLIYSFGVIHHTPNPEKVIRKCYELLKDNGEFKFMVYNKYSWKVLAMIINNLKSIKNIDKLISTYSEAQTGCPVTYSYTKNNIRKLLRKYSYQVSEVSINHIFPYRINEYKKYNYFKVWYFKVLPEWLFSKLEKLLGWHLCVTCLKKPK